MGVCSLNGNLGNLVNNGIMNLTAGSLNNVVNNKTINVYQKGITMNSLSSVGTNMNFFIKPSYMNTEEEILSVANHADMTNSTIRARVAKLSTVKAGDTVTLLKAGSLATAGMETAKLSDGFIKTKLDINTIDNAIIATVTQDEVEAEEDTKSLVETQSAGMALLNSSSDMLVNETINSAVEAIKTNVEQTKAAADKDPEKPMVETDRGMVPFATIGGNSLRLNTGSYVDTKSWNINVGFAKETKNKNSTFLFGPVFEYGRGSYDSYLDNGIHGSGDSRFWGIGLIAKQSMNSGLYVDGSLRVGRISNDYSSYFNDQNVNYDNSATYYAAHIGVGKIQPISKKNSIDYYLRLFYSHQNGSSATIQSGHVHDFDAINSWRTHLGFRYNHSINSNSELFAGLAWQHEFSGDSRATVHIGDWSASTPSPSLKGDTGIITLGYKVKPNNDDKFEIDLGLNGYVGKQQGFGANARFLWTF